MGNIQQVCGIIDQLQPNTHIEGGKNYDKPSPDKDGSGVIRVLMTANDYKQTENPLSCTIDGDNMMKLLQSCGIDDITYLKDEECQKDAVCEKMTQIIGQCGENDIFVFYYSGHGTSVPDKSGDEADGKDEALCFVDADGQVSYESCLIDDDFAACVTDALNPETRMLILTDCCHSGTIADLRSSAWAGHQVCCISGCTDDQTSGDIGKGGIMTHSMLKAIQDMEEQGEDDYSVADLYNCILDVDKSVFDSEQDITCSHSSACTPDAMAWPLNPKSSYTAPLSDMMG